MGIAVNIQPARIVHFTPNGQDDGTYFQCRFSGFVIITDGFGKTDLLTKPATDAQVSIDGIGKGYGLSILDGSGILQVKPAVVFIYTSYGAGLTALPAPRTFFRINITRIIPQGCKKMSGLSFKGFNL